MPGLEQEQNPIPNPCRAAPTCGRIKEELKPKRMHNALQFAGPFARISTPTSLFYKANKMVTKMQHFLLGFLLKLIDT
jgi:hypothetical protein